MNMKTRDKIIWNNIEALRLKKKLTYTDLAKKMGVKPQQINQIKSGERGIGNSMLRRFALALKVDEDTLLKQALLPQDKIQPSSMSQDIALLNITHRIDDLAKRIDAQGNALQGFQNDCLEVKNDIKDIYRLMTEAAEAKDVRKLKKVG